jgi:two-component sensor histidine kinase
MEVFPSIDELRSWADRLEEVQERLAPYFERAEPRQRAMAYIRGLLSTTERKNGWQLAELAEKPRQTACNACSTPRTGMRTRCAMTCKSTS